MAAITLTAGAIAALAGLLAAAGVATGAEHGASSAYTSNINNALKAELRRKYPYLSETQIDGLVAQYGDVDGGLFDVSKWGDQSDRAGLARTMALIENAYDELGEAPQQLSAEEIANLRQQGASDIEQENQQLLDLYNQTFNNNKNFLENALQENSQMFGDYRNQLLTNEAMQQQAIAGSTRFELDRQQRNAITRGASAAQRLVANINTQLGLQAQSAQRSLDTSNALAQNLLAHRQAQQGLRESYMNAQNNFTNQRASLLQGQTERKFNYGQSKVDAADYDRERAYDSWVDRRDDYFRGNSLASGIYGNGRRKQNNGL